LHKNVVRVATKIRDQKRERINKDRKINHPNFIVGDFVLVGILNKSKQKLRARWMGPRRITEVFSDWVYEVEDLITNKVRNYLKRKDSKKSIKDKALKWLMKPRANTQDV